MIYASSAALRVVALSVLAAALVGCGVSLSTQPAPASEPSDECNMARISGVLTRNAESGLGLRETEAFVRGVVWPFWYSARRDPSGVVVLIDRSGQIVAREGDLLEMAGGYGNGDIAYPCFDPHLRVVR